MSLWPTSAEAALDLVTRLAGWALLLQTLELLSLRRLYEPGGCFGWDLVGQFRLLGRWRLTAGLCRLLYSRRGYLCQICLRLAAGSLLLLADPSPLLSWVALVAWLSQLLLNHHLLPSGSNGSAHMMNVVLGAVAIRCWGGAALDLACCWFLAGQLGLSYCIPGLAKLRDPAWRNGSALLALAQHSFFGNELLRRQLGPRGLAKLAAWLTLAMEMLFPLVWFLPLEGVVFFMAWGLAFHTFNAIQLGLTPFLWTWIACYPVLIATKG